MKTDWEEEIKIALIKIESLHAEVEVGDFDATVTSFDKSRNVIRDLLAKKEIEFNNELRQVMKDHEMTLKQQHRAELESLRPEPSTLERDLNMNSFNNGYISGTEDAIEEFNKAITNLLEQKGK